MSTCTTPFGTWNANQFGVNPQAGFFNQPFNTPFTGWFNTPFNAFNTPFSTPPFQPQPFAPTTPNSFWGFNNQFNTPFTNQFVSPFNQPNTQPFGWNWTTPFNSNMPFSPFGWNAQAWNTPYAWNQTQNVPGFQTPGFQGHGFQNPTFQNPMFQGPGFQNWSSPFGWNTPYQATPFTTPSQTVPYTQPFGNVPFTPSFVWQPYGATTNNCQPQNSNIGINREAA